MTIQERKANLTLQEIKNEEQRRAEEAEALREAQQQEARKARHEIEVERVRRDRERQQARDAARATKLREQWEAGWIRVVMSRLPHGVPPELRFQILTAIRADLERLYGHGDIVGVTLQVTVERILRPWLQTKEAEKAAQMAREQLSALAWGEASWELRAKEAALAAIAELPDSASFEDMCGAARAAGKRIAAEYEQEEAEVRAQREAEQIRVRREAEAEMHLTDVLAYLNELQRDPNGWDFEGKLFEYANQIRQQIKPALIESLPLDLIAGRARVRQLVDQWLAAQ